MGVLQGLFIITVQFGAAPRFVTERHATDRDCPSPDGFFAATLWTVTQFCVGWWVDHLPTRTFWLVTSPVSALRVLAIVTQHAYLAK